MTNMTGLLGIAVILAVCWLMSENRRKINWRTVGVGMLLQVVLAFLILKVPPVRLAFDSLGNGIQGLLDCAKEGAAFVFGDELVKGRFVFALIIGSSIIFVGALTSLAYHWGILQRLVNALGYVFRKTMGVSGVEALSTGAETVLGQVESQMLISRYIGRLTRSELLGVMTAAMATISGSALVAYVGLGIHPTFLLMASFMTAPAAIVIAKMLVPETDADAINREAVLQDDRKSVNFIDAIADGASEGLKVALNVMTQLIAFIALVYLANKGLGAVLGLFGLQAGIQDIIGYFFAPVAWLIGVPSDEVMRVAPLLGTKTVLNEFIAYMDLAKMLSGPDALSERAQIITTVALCGFANLGSIGINIGGLSQMAPERKGDIARMGFKALVAATMAGWLSAAIAGLLI